MEAAEQRKVMVGVAEEVTNEQIEEIEMMLSEYLAGGFGELEGNPRLKALLDEAEGIVTDALAEGKEATFPEEFVRRFFEGEDPRYIDE